MRGFVVRRDIFLRNEFIEEYEHDKLSFEIKVNKRRLCNIQFERTSIIHGKCKCKCNW